MNKILYIGEVVMYDTEVIHIISGLIPRNTIYDEIYTHTPCGMPQPASPLYCRTLDGRLSDYCLYIGAIKFIDTDIYD